MMEINTADLCDEFPDLVTYLDIDIKSYGQIDSFYGEVATLKVYEDNSLVKKELQKDGTGKVLVVDGGGSRRCALVGDNLAQLAIDNNWNGLIIYGCIRDAKQISEMPVAIMAMGTCPRKSMKRNEGQEGVTLTINNVQINQGNYVYADADGILFSEMSLS